MSTTPRLAFVPLIQHDRVCVTKVTPFSTREKLFVMVALPLSVMAPVGEVSSIVAHPGAVWSAVVWGIMSLVGVCVAAMGTPAVMARRHRRLACSPSIWITMDEYEHRRIEFELIRSHDDLSAMWAKLITARTKPPRLLRWWS